MQQSLITSTVIGTSAVIGALAFSAGGAIARTDSLGVSKQQALKEGSDLLILIRGGGGGGGHAGGIAGAAHGFGGGHMGGVAGPMTPTSPMQAAPLPEGVLSHARPTAGLPGRMLRQPVPEGAMRSPAAPTVTPPANTTMSNSRSSAAAALGLATLGIPPAPPDRVMPPPEIAQPQPELAPLSPISPQLPTQFSTGGTVLPNMALSPGASSSASPSGSAPSTPGGGGKSLADCMGFWDRATHMSKAEWKTACVRSMEDDPSVTG